MELQAHRQSARAAIAAAVGPLDVRRMVWAPIASTGPCGRRPLSLHACSVAATVAENDVAVSHARDFAVVAATRRVDRLAGVYPGLLRLLRAYLQKPRGVQVPVVGGFGQSAADWHNFVQIIII